MNDSTLYANWYTALIIAAVVVVLAALLLVLLWMAARRIQKVAQEILQLVTEIKENTQSIWSLQETNRLANAIRNDSKDIKDNAQSMVDILQQTPK